MLQTTFQTETVNPLREQRFAYQENPTPPPEAKTEAPKEAEQKSEAKPEAAPKEPDKAAEEILKKEITEVKDAMAPAEKEAGAAKDAVGKRAASEDINDAEAKKTLDDIWKNALKDVLPPPPPSVKPPLASAPQTATPDNFVEKRPAAVKEADAAETGGAEIADVTQQTLEGGLDPNANAEASKPNNTEAEKEATAKSTEAKDAASKTPEMGGNPIENAVDVLQNADNPEELNESIQTAHEYLNKVEEFMTKEKGAKWPGGLTLDQTMDAVWQIHVGADVKPQAGIPPELVNGKEQLENRSSLVYLKLVWVWLDQPVAKEAASQSSGAASAETTKTAASKEAKPEGVGEKPQTAKERVQQKLQDAKEGPPRNADQLVKQNKERMQAINKEIDTYNTAIDKYDEEADGYDKQIEAAKKELRGLEAGANEKEEKRDTAIALKRNEIDHLIQDRDAARNSAKELVEKRTALEQEYNRLGEENDAVNEMRDQVAKDAEKRNAEWKLIAENTQQVIRSQAERAEWTSEQTTEACDLIAAITYTAGEDLQVHAGLNSPLVLERASQNGGDSFIRMEDGKLVVGKEQVDILPGDTLEAQGEAKIAKGILDALSAAKPKQMEVKPVAPETSEKEPGARAGEIVERIQEIFREGRELPQEDTETTALVEELSGLLAKGIDQGTMFAAIEGTDTMTNVSGESFRLTMNADRTGVTLERVEAEEKKPESEPAKEEAKPAEIPVAKTEAPTEKVDAKPTELTKEQKDEYLNKAGAVLGKINDWLQSAPAEPRTTAEIPVAKTEAPTEKVDEKPLASAPATADPFVTATESNNRSNDAYANASREELQQLRTVFASMETSKFDINRAREIVAQNIQNEIAKGTFTKETAPTVKVGTDGASLVLDNIPDEYRTQITHDQAMGKHDMIYDLTGEKEITVRPTRWAGKDNMMGDTRTA